MTIRDEMVFRLVQSGLFPEEAELVMVDVVTASEKPGGVTYPIEFRWHDEIDGYGPAASSLLAVVWAIVKGGAVAWLDEHAPQHRARTALVGDAA